MSARAKSVLVVDDGPLVRQKLCEMLTREGDFDLCGEALNFDLCGEALNGRDAIEKAQQLRPDLIIMVLDAGDERPGSSANPEKRDALDADHNVQ